MRGQVGGDRQGGQVRETGRGDRRGGQVGGTGGGDR